EEVLDATRHWAKVEGIFAAPEGAACLVAYRKLRASGFFQPEDTVVLFNTGSGLKYLDVLDAGVATAGAGAGHVGAGDPSTSLRAGSPARSEQPAARQIGGI